MQSNADSLDADVDEAPPERRAALERLRAPAAETFPDAVECIGHGMPVWKGDRVMRVAFAGKQGHVGVCGLGADIVERCRTRPPGVEFRKTCVTYRKPDAIDFTPLVAMMVEARDAGRPAAR